MSSIQGFFRYARLRESVRLRKEQQVPKPWTDDPILQRYRFCNVFREDDRTTRWFADHVRGPMIDSPRVILATITFRWFNKIETGEVLLKHGLLQNWNGRLALEVLQDLKPLITGAYMIKTPPKKTKLVGLVDLIDEAQRKGPWLREVIADARTLEVAWEALKTLPYLGSFMAYEVVTDLRHTEWLCGATDINTWCSPGPGCARGLGRLFGKEGRDSYSYTSLSDRRRMRPHLERLLSLSQRDNLWPSEWRAWEMREVEHTLCEYDKYERVRLGEGAPKQLYPGK